MDKKLSELRGQFEATVSEAKALLSKDGGATAEDMTRVTELNATASTLKTEIEGLMKAASDLKGFDSFLNDPATKLHFGNQGQGASVAQASASGATVIDKSAKGTEVYQEGDGLIDDAQSKAIADPAYKRAFNEYVRRKGSFAFMPLAEQKILQVGVDNAGGFLVPEEFMARIISKSPAPTRLAARVTRLTAGGDSLTIPRTVYATDDIYSTGIRATLTGEVPSSSTVHRVTEPVFGQTRIQIGTWMMSMPLTNDMVEDSSFPILQWASDKFFETVQLLFENQILNGTGVGANPHGILKNPGGTDEPAVKLSSTANDIDANQIRGIPWDVAEQYINENTAWVYNRAVCGEAIAKLVDSNGQYLFRMGAADNGLGARVPDTLDGFPIIYSAFAPNIGDGLFPIVFGDLAGYYLAVRTGFSVQILNEIEAQSNQVVMLGRLRFGGVVAEPFRMIVGKSDNA